MTMRRRAPTFRRRKRSRSDLLPMTACGQVVPVDGNPNHTSCDQPLSDTDNSFEILQFPNLTGNSGPTEGQEAIYNQKLSRGLKFRGCQFDLNILSNILFEQSSTGFLILTVRVALAVVDLDPESGAVLLTPLGHPPFNLFSLQEMSKGDILWRSQFHVDVIHTQDDAGTYFSENCPCFDNGLQRMQHVRVRVKTRRNLREHQGLALIWNVWNPLSEPTAFVYDLFGFAAVQNWASR